MQDAAVLGTRVLFGVLRAACWVLWNAMGSVAGSSESGVGVALADKAESRSSGTIQMAGRGNGVVLHVVSVQYRIGTHLDGMLCWKVASGCHGREGLWEDRRAR